MTQMNAKASQTLKQLESQKSRHEATIADLEKRLADIQSNLGKERTKLRDLNAGIERLKSKDPVVTEHAIIRYLEKACALRV